MDIKTAVIYRLNDLINQKDITVNEAAVCSGVPPSTLKNILYGQSKNAGVVTIKKICDGLDVHLCRFGTRTIGRVNAHRIQILQDGFFMKNG